MFKFKKKHVITDLEKTEIVIEYLKDEIKIYQDMGVPSMDPIRVLEIALNYEERKHYFMTKDRN